jgi:DNA polymerase elongation subunit (family B)
MIFKAEFYNINKMEKSNLFSYSWSIDDKETNRTVIRIYGINEKHENVCLIVNNFTPYVYIELPTHIEWDSGNAQLVVSKIDDILKERKPIVKQLMFKKRLYYANVDLKNKRKLFPYLFCCFSHSEDIKQLNYKTRRPLNISKIGIILLSDFVSEYVADYAKSKPLAYLT